MPSNPRPPSISTNHNQPPRPTSEIAESKSPPEYFPATPRGAERQYLPPPVPSTSAEKMADLDRVGKEVAAKFLFQQRATRAAVSAATGDDRMETDSAEVGPELTEEQHRQALDAESRVVYLMDHRGEDCV